MLEIKDEQLLDKIMPLFIFDGVKKKEEKPMIEKYINICYNDISYNLLIKLGTPLKDIIDELNIKSTLININNIMLKDINDLIITPDINNIEIK